MTPWLADVVFTRLSLKSVRGTSCERRLNCQSYDAEHKHLHTLDFT